MLAFSTMIMHCIYKQKKKKHLKYCLEAVMVILKSEVGGTTHSTFYLQILTGKPNEEKRFSLLMFWYQLN